jgi:diacylglycerol kinase (ATP)
MRVLIIINPAAGANRALARWGPLEPQFGENGIQVQQVLTKGPEDATRLAQKAADEYDLLVVGGGDGTIAEVVAGMLASGSNRAALGILPLGTGNDLAETLGIRTLLHAVQTITSGQTKPIDVLRVHCRNHGGPVVRYAVLFAGVGIISEALKKTSHGLKRLFGQRLAYPAGLVRALLTYRSV